MLKKEDITCLKGRAEILITADIDLDKFQDIYDWESEWDSIEDVGKDIEEFLFDDIEQYLFYLLKNAKLDEQIDYKIKINGITIK